MANKKCRTLLLEWLMTLVLVINIVQLTTISVRFAIDYEDFAREWKYTPSTLGKYIAFDTVFAVWIGCIVTGLTHNILFAIGEAIDSDCLMLSSIVLGALKEVVSIFFSNVKNVHFYVYVLICRLSFFLPFLS